MESKKLSLKNLFTVEKQNNGETKRIDLWTRGGQSEMYGKSNMETYITICKIDSQLGWFYPLWRQTSLMTVVS